MSLSLINGSDGTGEAVVATVSAARTAGSMSISVSGLAHWPASFVATSGKQLSGGVLSTPLVFSGHKSGTNTIVIDTIAPGYTDGGNQVSDIIVLKPSTMWADNIGTTLAVSHTDTGALNTAAITQVTAGLSGQTLRLKPRISVTTSIATLAPNIDSYNIYELNAQAANLTISNPAGTPNDGDILLIRLKDSGTSRTVSFGAAYIDVSGAGLLTATTAGKWHYIGIQWNAGAAAWHVISTTTAA